jgi:diguanylate cyclase (GGDEF)-like protein/PAS domain S-box-containing protein
MPGEAESSLQFLAENSIDVICRAGVDMLLHYVSPSCCQILGWKPEEMVGKRIADFFLPKDASALDGKSPATLHMRMKNGLLAWVEIRHRTTRDSATGIREENILVIHDLTERKILEDRLSALERTDPRTGLCTTLAFDEALALEWNRTLRDGSQISLLLLDFHDFRQFHDWREHLEGDSCLAKAAAAVMGALRVTDLAAHYGTEEIIIMLPATGSRGAARVAAKVRSAIEPLRSRISRKIESRSGETVMIGASTVLARAGGTMRMPEILQLAADSALRKAIGREMEAHGHVKAS